MIVAGHLTMAPDDREEFLRGHRHIVEESRKAPGCVDLSISPDPLDPGRVNIFEHWESPQTLDDWRSVAPPPKCDVQINDGSMYKHDVAKSGPPFDA
ncbi:antibiotic biosynthesis monooxygenase family protein [Actinosynnema sp. NPDC047251]|uniref:putative quinol monooxygenase n=1 Tax=Saccharothrix espanaensis TaxID=103731 RepID=UPI001E3ED685|nr:antibiotic biosynthesis monooxygenase family protein [Saccharothrix espanaensis]